MGGVTEYKPTSHSVCTCILSVISNIHIIVLAVLQFDVDIYAYGFFFADGEDYVGGSFVRIFNFNITTSCVRIVIAQDNIIEVREEFRVEISSEDNLVNIPESNSSSIVFIDEEIGKRVKE